MACCLTAPSHYMSQCWLSSKVFCSIHLRAISQGVHLNLIQWVNHLSVNHVYMCPLGRRCCLEMFWSRTVPCHQLITKSSLTFVQVSLAIDTCSLIGWLRDNSVYRISQWGKALLCNASLIGWAHTQNDPWIISLFHISNGSSVTELIVPSVIVRFRDLSLSCRIYLKKPSNIFA